MAAPWSLKGEQQHRGVRVCARSPRQPTHGRTYLSRHRSVRSTTPAGIVGDRQSAFDAVGAPLLRRMREGYNTTLLAYGQTGSGKTYTVFGPTGSLSEASLGEGAGGAPPAWGVFPRIALDMIKSSGNLKASAIEIYNNQPFDLLNDRSPLKMSRSSNSTVVTHRVTSKRGPDERETGTNQNVGLNGEHPPS